MKKGKRAIDMGMFFENYHIKMSDGDNQKKLKEAIESVFAKQGYVSCDEESATKSLVLSTSETGNWTSMIFAEENEGEVDREFCSNVFLKLVEQMDAYGLIVNCVDSDFAMLRLVSIDEDIDSAITIGDSYTGEVTEKEAIRDWESVVDTEKLYEVCCGDYTFAEEGLEKAAELLGLDKNQVFLTGDATSDEGLTTLYFKKKNQRRKSFKTLFLEIFEEGLKDEGFVRVKSKYPYLARMVGEEVYQVITYKDVWCAETYDPETKGCKAFTVLSTFSSLYNPFFSFGDPPKEQNGNLYDIGIFRFYKGVKEKLFKERDYIIYDPDSLNSIISAINKSLQISKKLIITEYANVDDLNTCLMFRETFSRYNQRLPFYDETQNEWIDMSGEGCLYYIIGEIFDIKNFFNEYEDKYRKLYDNSSDTEINTRELNEFREIIFEKEKKRKEFFEDINTRREYLAVMEERKKTKVNELACLNIL